MTRQIYSAIDRANTPRWIWNTEVIKNRTLTVQVHTFFSKPPSQQLDTYSLHFTPGSPEPTFAYSIWTPKQSTKSTSDPPGSPQRTGPDTPGCAPAPCYQTSSLWAPSSSLPTTEQRYQAPRTPPAKQNNRTLQLFLAVLPQPVQPLCGGW